MNKILLFFYRNFYKANPRPDALMKEQIVEMSGLSPRVIRVWFQNKRCKDKKMQIKQEMQQERVSYRWFSQITKQHLSPICCTIFNLNRSFSDRIAINYLMKMESKWLHIRQLSRTHYTTHIQQMYINITIHGIRSTAWHWPKMATNRLSQTTRNLCI